MTTATDTIRVIAPANGELLAEVPAHTAEDTSSAFGHARQVQKTWAQTSIRERREIMLRYHDLVLDHQDEMMDLIQDESGKNRVSAHEEILDSAFTARHFAYAAQRLLKPQRVRGGIPLITEARVEHPPVGVVGVISPWNYPLVLAASDAIAALMAGNGVVLKPDDKTPLTALRAVELLEEAGLPKGLFQVVTGSGSVVGQAVVEECDYLMFTGSTATGRQLAAQASERLIGFSAELGGKNPMIVARDADVDKAARGALKACFSNSGQLCISIERIYVHRDIAEEFTEKLLHHVRDIRIGAGHAWTVDMGSLISRDHLETVDSFVQDAVSHGARVLTGGHPLPEIGEAFYAPTVLAGVPPAAELHHNEVFGPVVYLETVDSDDEAVRRANDTDYGLNASVWATPRTGRELASRLQAGTVNVNEGYAASWVSMAAPMGGWKASGVGRRHGEEGLLKYTEPRTVAVQRIMPTTGPEGIDQEKFAKVAAGALKAVKRILR